MRLTSLKLTSLRCANSFPGLSHNSHVLFILCRFPILFKAQNCYYIMKPSRQGLTRQPNRYVLYHFKWKKYFAMTKANDRAYLNAQSGNLHTQRGEFESFETPNCLLFSAVLYYYEYFSYIVVDQLYIMISFFYNP